MAKFVNSAKPVDVKAKLPWLNKKQDLGRYYIYDAPSPLMFIWSGTLQACVSQAATMMLTGKFHNQRHGIYKAQGGCNIPEVGPLILYEDCVAFDFTSSTSHQKALAERDCAALVSQIVLDWDPEDPIESMLEAACDAINNVISPETCSANELREAIEKSSSGSGCFSGDSLSDFFSHNPFMKFPVDRDYHRFCLLHHDRDRKWTEEEIDQLFADEDLAEKMLNDLNKMDKKVLSCKADRSSGSLRFWVNAIDLKSGWYSQEEIAKLIGKRNERTKV